MTTEFCSNFSSKIDQAYITILEVLQFVFFWPPNLKHIHELFSKIVPTHRNCFCNMTQHSLVDKY
jgi:hypothetical protein